MKCCEDYKGQNFCPVCGMQLRRQASTPYGLLHYLKTQSELATSRLATAIRAHPDRANGQQHANANKWKLWVEFVEKALGDVKQD